MARLTPFSYSFSCPQGANEWKLGLTGRHKLLKSITVEIEDDNLGPILINVYLKVEGKKNQISNPTVIYDGEGSNAKRFVWVGEQPLSTSLPNVLVVQHTNHCGTDINSVRVSGVLQR